MYQSISSISDSGKLVKKVGLAAAVAILCQAGTAVFRPLPVFAESSDEFVRFSSLTGDFAALDGADLAPGKMFVETVGADTIDVDVVDVP